MTITPAAQPSSRIANASSGVGSGRGRTYAVSPAPVITSAVSRANTSELWRASYPITTEPRGDAGVVEVRRQAGRGADHDDPVHPVRPGAERAAQAGGAELEGAGEPVPQVGRVAALLDLRDDRLELGAGLRVGVVGEPGAGGVEEVLASRTSWGHDTRVRATYTFSGTWEIAAPVADVHAVLVDLEHYPDWWPQVVAVASLGPDDARVLCRSALPYTLDLVLHAVDRSPEHLEVGVSGDLEGSVRFALAPVPAAPASTSPRRSRSPGCSARRRTSPVRCCAGTTTG